MDCATEPDLQQLSALDVLDPAKFPADQDDARGHGTREIAAVANQFGIEAQCNTGRTDELCRTTERWQELVSYIYEKRANELQLYRNNAVEFWSTLLGDGFVGWDEFFPDIRRLIKTVLVLPAGSSDAERGFSVMGHVKDYTRNRLSHGPLEAAIRIKVNGPEQQDFDPAPYVKEWFRVGKMPSDSKIKQVATQFTEKERLFIAQIEKAEDVETSSKKEALQYYKTHFKSSIF